MLRALVLALVVVAGCKDRHADDSAAVSWQCQLAEGSDPDFANQLGCESDFEILASVPADASIPGATSVKTVIDRSDNGALYFQNSKRYCIHWDFASTHLSGDGLPIVAALSQFNLTEYYSPDRRFVLGAVSHYEGPDKWVYEISPYDTADAEMVAYAYRIIAANMWNGEQLYFHPTSASVDAIVPDLPSDVQVITSNELYEGVDYQPLNLGTTTGLLSFHTAAEVEGGYTPFRELVVLDTVPNDISIVAGIITSDYQTPLAHINVLSVNRGTPNMALRGAQELAELQALDGKWVELTVGAFDWEIHEITADEAEAWWEQHRPEPLVVSPMDFSATELTDNVDIIDLDNYSLSEAIQMSIPKFGAKATNYAVMEEAVSRGSDIPIQPGFAIPMFYYNQFMEDNGLWDRIRELMASEEWSDPSYRDEALLAFKDELRAAPMRPEVVALITNKCLAMFPGEYARFRSSTNSEDLGAFTGAGLYNSETGQPLLGGSDNDSIEWAVKKVWSQVWNPRAYEEREYFGMNHLDVGMALLVHPNFPDEEANGVAITNNPYDSTGLEPAFYVNAQYGDADIVSPQPGETPDAYLHYYYYPGQPIVFIQHSSLIPEGETVLTTTQSYELAEALDTIHNLFMPAYGSDGGWYALDVEWKFDDKYTPGDPALFIKQARPFPGWSTDATGGCVPE